MTKADRVSILLSDRQPRRATDIATALKLPSGSSDSVGPVLRKLEKAGIIRRRGRNGRILWTIPE